MKFTYDSQAKAFYIKLIDEPDLKSNNVRMVDINVLADFTNDERLYGIELLNVQPEEVSNIVQLYKGE
jgi:uncharacterized protein YuzE